MAVSTSYGKAREYLLSYARDDWLMLSFVVDRASGLAGREATNAEVAEVTVRLATDLIDDGSPPGELVADDRDFVPWPGDRVQRLRRFRDELFAFVERDELPQVGDICWFHHVLDRIG